MDTSSVISLTGAFLKTVGEVVADVKRSRVDADLLRLKRKYLSEKLEDFESQLTVAVVQEKARAEQNLISRGLAGTTIRQSTILAIERDASNELDKVTREYNRAIEEIALLERKAAGTRSPSEVMPTLKLFISHCSKDIAVVEPLVDLLQSALNLPASDIRCTGIDGCRLPGGADTDEQLRGEVHDSEAFIGVISLASISSMFVVFELGARWGVKKHLIPVLSPGTSPSVLAGPLKGLNALQLDSAAQIHQLVEDLGRKLKIAPQSAAAYQKHIEAILENATEHAAATEEESITTNQDATAPSLSDAAKRLLLEVSQDRGGHVMMMQCLGGMSVDTNGKNLIEQGNPRSEAMWEGAIQELLDHALLQEQGSKGEVFKITIEGYRVADLLRECG